MGFAVALWPREANSISGVGAALVLGRSLDGNKRVSLYLPLARLNRERELFDMMMTTQASSRASEMPREKF